MAGYDDGYSVSGPFVGTFPASTRNKITVPNPDDPSQLIWVDAKEVNGSLMPVDPRYSVTRGGDSSGALGLLIVAGLLLFAFSHR